jgi:hypothetical protein
MCHVLLAAEQAEHDRRTAIDQQQVLPGMSTAPSEINWTPATFISNKKQMSSALGIVRNIDKSQASAVIETTKKTLVSYDDDDDDDDDDDTS